MTTNGWAKVGKFLLGAIAAITGIIGIYTFFKPKEPQVFATGECYKFSLPDSYYKQLNQLTKLPDSNEIEKLLPEKLDNRYQVAMSIQNFITTEKNLNLVRDTKAWSQVCRFVISNTGQKEAQNIKLNSRLEGIYQIEKSGEPTKSDVFSGAISTGNLDPGGESIVTVWNRFASFTAGFDTLRISHSEGVSEIDMKKPWYHQSPWTIFFNTSISIFIVVGVLWVVFWLGRASKGTARIDDNESGITSEVILEQPNSTPSTPEQEVAPPSPS